MTVSLRLGVLSKRCSQLKVGEVKSETERGLRVEQAENTPLTFPLAVPVQPDSIPRSNSVWRVIIAQRNTLAEPLSMPSPNSLL